MLAGRSNNSIIAAGFNPTCVEKVMSGDTGQKEVNGGGTWTSP